MTTQSECLNWHAHAHVDKFSGATVEEVRHMLGYEPTGADFARLGIAPDDTADADGNGVVNLGKARVAGLIIGNGSVAFDSTHAFIGVGSNTTAFAAAQAALSGDGSSATAWYQATTVAPSLTTTTTANDTISAGTSFAAGNANFAWGEWCFGIATTIVAGATFATVGTSPVMLNRKVNASLGTKANPAVWVFTGTVQLS